MGYVVEERRGAQNKHDWNKVITLFSTKMVSSASIFNLFKSDRPHIFLLTQKMVSPVRLELTTLPSGNKAGAVFILLG